MGIRLVVGGIGKGSIFGHGRIFGIHKPWDDDQSKASDPFINAATLGRIANRDKALIPKIVENLASRWSTSFHPSELRRFLAEGKTPNALNILKQLTSDSRMPDRVIAHIISILAPPGWREEVDEEATREATEHAYAMWNTSGSDPAYSRFFPPAPILRDVEEHDVRLITHYHDSDLKRLHDILSFHNQSRRSTIMFHLKALNPLLAEGISRFPFEETQLRIRKEDGKLIVEGDPEQIAQVEKMLEGITSRTALV